MAGEKEKISVVLPNHLGDVVMATPALRALRRGRPEARISAVVRRTLAPVLRGSPWLDEILEHDIYAGRGITAAVHLAKIVKPLQRVGIRPGWRGEEQLSLVRWHRCSVGSIQRYRFRCRRV